MSTPETDSFWLPDNTDEAEHTTSPEGDLFNWELQENQTQFNVILSRSENGKPKIEFAGLEDSPNAMATIIAVSRNSLILKIDVLPQQDSELPSLNADESGGNQYISDLAMALGAMNFTTDISSRSGGTFIAKIFPIDKQGSLLHAEAEMRYQKQLVNPRYSLTRQEGQYTYRPFCLAETNLSFIRQDKNYRIGRLADNGILSTVVVQEYIPGIPLNQIVSQDDSTPYQKTEIIKNLIKAVFFYHSDVNAATPRPHGDLKPENIICQFDEEGDTVTGVKVIDTGQSPDGTTDFKTAGYFPSWRVEENYYLDQEKSEKKRRVDLMMSDFYALAITILQFMDSTFHKQFKQAQKSFKDNLDVQGHYQKVHDLIEDALQRIEDDIPQSLADAIRHINKVALNQHYDIVEANEIRERAYIDALNYFSEFLGYSKDK